MKTVKDLTFIEYKTDQGLVEDPVRDKLFDLWYNEWYKAYLDFGSVDFAEALSADDFINKRILSLWFDDNPVAMIILDEFRIDFPFNSFRKYIKNLPTGMIKSLQEKGYKKAHSLNNLVVSKGWRKKETDIPVSQILTSTGYALAKVESSDVMICYVRNERKINEVIKQHNSIIYSTCTMHNSENDFLFTPMLTANIFPTTEIEKACLRMLKMRFNELTKLKFNLNKHVYNNDAFLADISL